LNFHLHGQRHLGERRLCAGAAKDLMPAARISFSLELSSATTYFSTSAGVIGIGGSRVIGPHWVIQV
jgi:hypothetical protein